MPEPAQRQALRIGPSEHVRKAEVAERVLGIAPKEAQQLGTEDQPMAEAGRESEREVDLQSRLLGDRPPDRLGLHNP